MPVNERDQRYLDDLRSVASRIKDNFTLCMFMGKTEREILVAQTVKTATFNLGQHGEPYSIRGAGVFTVVAGGLFDNNSAYRYLVDNRYFEEEKRGEDVVIFPTRKLLDALLGFLAQQKH